jgi:hypothetical protein
VADEHNHVVLVYVLLDNRVNEEPELGEQYLLALPELKALDGYPKLDGYRAHTGL